MPAIGIAIAVPELVFGYRIAVGVADLEQAGQRNSLIFCQRQVRGGYHRGMVEPGEAAVRPLQPFNIAQAVCSVRRTGTQIRDLIVPDSKLGNLIGRGRAGVAGRIQPAVSIEVIISAAALQQIVAIAAMENVITPAARQGVNDVLAEDLRATVEGITGVVAGSEMKVHPGNGMQSIVAARGPAHRHSDILEDAKV